MSTQTTHRAGEWYDLDVLAGEDARRTPGVLTVEIVNGEPHDVRLGKLAVVGETTLVGWGELDGPAVNVQPEEAAWYVSVPRRTWDALLAGQLRAIDCA